MAEMLSKDNPAFASFMVCSAVLFLKMAAVVFMTVFYRNTKKVYANPEDVKFGDPDGKKDIKIVRDDPDVERVLRVHRNDLENIIPFMLIGLFYLTTNPEASCAILCFRAFTAARILHSVIYLNEIRQPFRSLSFLSGFFVTIYMAVKIIQHYM